MEDWVLLLLPVAAASGWYAAKKHFTQKYLVDHGQALRQAYCRGLNYLLSEKTDKAIDTFASLLESDSETIETHIALGNLFRRRGELEKAIEIHERLMFKPQLESEQRAAVQYELGLDYQRSGLFDRAESIFNNLVDHPTRGKAALQQLLVIFQHEKEWLKAIDCTRRLATLGKLPRGETVAQFLCELAEEVLDGEDEEKALAYLEQALVSDPGCVRASLILARLRLGDGRYADALQMLKRVETQNPVYIPEILEPLQICYERLQLPMAELLDYLARLYQDYGFEAAALVMAHRLKMVHGRAEAVEHLQSVLDKQPSLRALNALTGLMLEDDGNVRVEALIRIDRATGRMSEEQARYRCLQCGFSGAELHWRCPSCRHWESIRPVAGTGEAQTISLYD